MPRLAIRLPLPAADPAGSRSLKVPSLKTTSNAMRAQNFYMCATHDVSGLGGARSSGRSRRFEGAKPTSLNWRRAHPQLTRQLTRGQSPEGCGSRAFSTHRVQATDAAMERSLSRRPLPGRRIVVQRVAPVAMGPPSLDWVSPMRHGFEAALFLVDLLPTMLPHPGLNKPDAPLRRRSRPVTDTRQLEHGIACLSASPVFRYAPPCPTKV